MTFTDSMLLTWNLIYSLFFLFSCAAKIPLFFFCMHSTPSSLDSLLCTAWTLAVDFHFLAKWFCFPRLLRSLPLAGHAVSVETCIAPVHAQFIGCLCYMLLVLASPDSMQGAFPCLVSMAVCLNALCCFADISCTRHTFVTVSQFQQFHAHLFIVYLKGDLVVDHLFSLTFVVSLSLFPWDLWGMFWRLHLALTSCITVGIALTHHFYWVQSGHQTSLTQWQAPFPVLEHLSDRRTPTFYTHLWLFT